MYWQSGWCSQVKRRFNFLFVVSTVGNSKQSSSACWSNTIISNNHHHHHHSLKSIPFSPLYSRTRRKFHWFRTWMVTESNDVFVFQLDIADGWILHVLLFWLHWYMIIDGQIDCVIQIQAYQGIIYWRLYWCGITCRKGR